MKYTWLDKKSGREIVVEREVKMIDMVPRLDEAEEGGMSVDEYEDAQWSRLITGGTGTIGFGQKGYWMRAEDRV